MAMVVFLPRLEVIAMKISLEIMNIFQKCFEASEWHWLILAPIGASVYLGTHFDTF